MSTRNLLSLIAALTGIALVLLGTLGGWGLVWTLAGGFFMTVALGTVILTLAWSLEGRPGELLRHPAVSILIIAAVLAMLLLTVGAGIFQ